MFTRHGLAMLLMFAVPAAASAQAVGGLDDLVLPPSAAAQAAAPAVPEKTPDDAAFEEAMKTLQPSSPHQIQEFRGTLDDTRRAIARPMGPVTPVSRSVQVALRPGEVPPTIHLAAGHVSTITFSDVTGAPWPVLAVATGDPSAYQAQSAGPQGETNIIVVSPLSYHAFSNMVVTLVDHPVPVVLKLETDTQKVDYRLDVRIAARGPKAAFDTVYTSMLPPTGDAVMQAFLDGVPPSGAVRLRTAAGEVEAWAFDGMMYVRTQSSLLSPAYVGTAANVSGVKVYVLNDTPVLLVSNGGRMSTVNVIR